MADRNEHAIGRLIDSELRRSRHRDNQQGLTTWIAAAATASLTWILLQSWPTLDTDLADVALLYVLLASWYAAARLAFSALAIPSGEVGEARYSLARTVALSPIATAIDLARVAAYGFGVFLARDFLPLWCAIALALGSVLVMLWITIVAVWSRSDLPVKAVPTGTKYMTRVRVAALVAAFAGALAVSTQVQVVPPGTGTPAIQLAALLFAIGYLTAWWARTGAARRYTLRLESLERRLGLGAIGLDQAHAELEVLVLGDSADLVGAWVVGDLPVRQADLNDELAQLRSAVAHYRIAVRDAPAPLDAPTLTSHIELLDAVAGQAARTRTHLDIIREGLRAAERRQRLADLLHPEADRTVEAALSKLLDGQTATEEIISDTEAVFASARRDWQSATGTT